MLPQLRWPPIVGILFLSMFLFANLRVYANSCLSASSCTDCVKANKDCGWCTDPQYNGSIRCDLKTNLESKCAQQHIYDPKTEMKIPKQHNFPLGKKQTDGQTVTQLEPQQVQVKIKPGLYSKEDARQLFTIIESVTQDFDSERERNSCDKLASGTILYGRL